MDMSSSFGGLVLCGLSLDLPHLAEDHAGAAHSMRVLGIRE